MLVKMLKVTFSWPIIWNIDTNDNFISYFYLLYLGTVDLEIVHLETVHLGEVGFASGQFSLVTSYVRRISITQYWQYQSMEFSVDLIVSYWVEDRPAHSMQYTPPQRWQGRKLSSPKTPMTVRSQMPHCCD